MGRNSSYEHHLRGGRHHAGYVTQALLAVDGDHRRITGAWSLVGHGRLMDLSVRVAHADEPIKIGILDPLSSPYKTSSIHDVHGANVAVDLFNKKGGVLGRPVAILEADDASNPDQAVKVATKFIKDDRVDVLMGTFNGDCALAVSALAAKEDKLFMVTAAHIPELSGAACARIRSSSCPCPHAGHAVVPHLARPTAPAGMITASTIDGKSCAQALVDASQAHKSRNCRETVTPFGATDFGRHSCRQSKQPTAIILNLYGWDLVNALKGYAKLEMAKEKIGVGGLISGEQIGRPLGYNAGIWD